MIVISTIFAVRGASGPVQSDKPNTAPIVAICSVLFVVLSLLTSLVYKARSVLIPVWKRRRRRLKYDQSPMNSYCESYSPSVSSKEDSESTVDMLIDMDLSQMKPLVKGTIWSLDNDRDTELCQ